MWVLVLLPAPCSVVALKPWPLAVPPLLSLLFFLHEASRLVATKPIIINRNGVFIIVEFSFFLLVLFSFVHSYYGI